MRKSLEAKSIKLQREREGREGGARERRERRGGRGESRGERGILKKVYSQYLFLGYA